jgi:hypothetical protein
LVAPDERLGWAVAAWAVTQAEDQAINAVEAGNLRWQREWGEWRERTADAALPAGEVLAELSD